MKTILITGGSKGIGASIVKEALLKGYYVVFTYNKTRISAISIEKRFKNQYLLIKVNLEKDKDRKRLFQIIKKKKIKD